MKMISIVVAGLSTAILGLSTAADAQAWGPPPPPPPYGFAPPPPPPLPGPRVVQHWHWGEPGFHPYHPRCWIEYRNNGWDMVKVCQ